MRRDLAFGRMKLPWLVLLGNTCSDAPRIAGLCTSLNKASVAADAQLDPEMIKSLGGNRYSLAVPRTSLFNVWVEPIVEVEVNLALTGAQRAVIIQVNLRVLSAVHALQRRATPCMHLTAPHSTVGAKQPLAQVAACSPTGVRLASENQHGRHPLHAGHQLGFARL